MFQYANRLARPITTQSARLGIKHTPVLKLYSPILTLQHQLTTPQHVKPSLYSPLYRTAHSSATHKPTPQPAHTTTQHSTTTPSVASAQAAAASVIPEVHTFPEPYTKPGWVNSFNDSIQFYPLSTIASLAAIEAGTFAAINVYLTTHTTYQFNTVWLVAYLLSWPLRRSIIVKLVCSPVLAVPMAWLIPPLRHVDLTKLISNPTLQSLLGRGGKNSKDVTAPTTSHTGLDTSVISSANTNHTDTTTASTTLPPNTQPDNKSLGIAARLRNFTQTYGLSAFISYRLVGAAVLLWVYTLLDYGVNVQGMIQKLGVDINADYIKSHNKSSVYVVSLLMCAVAFPINMIMLPYMVRYLVAPVSRRVTGLFSRGKK